MCQICPRLVSEQYSISVSRVCVFFWFVILIQGLFFCFMFFGTHSTCACWCLTGSVETSFWLLCFALCDYPGMQPSNVSVVNLLIPTVFVSSLYFLVTLRMESIHWLDSNGNSSPPTVTLSPIIERAAIEALPTDEVDRVYFFLRILGGYSFVCFLFSQPLVGNLFFSGYGVKSAGEILCHLCLDNVAASKEIMHTFHDG